MIQVTGDEETREVEVEVRGDLTTHDAHCIEMGIIITTVETGTGTGMHIEVNVTTGKVT